MGSRKDEWKCDYPWEGETEDTMKQRHKRDRQFLFEREGRDVERAGLSLAIDQAKWEYEKRGLMRSWTTCMQDGKELEAKADIRRIEEGEEKLLKRRREVAQLWMQYGLQKEELEATQAVEVELFNAKFGMSQSARVKLAEETKKRQKEEMDKVTGVEEKRVSELARGIQEKYRNWVEWRKRLSYVRAETWAFTGNCSENASSSRQIEEEEERFLESHEVVDKAMTWHKLKKDLMQVRHEMEWLKIGPMVKNEIETSEKEDTTGRREIIDEDMGEEGKN